MMRRSQAKDLELIEHQAELRQETFQLLIYTRDIPQENAPFKGPNF